MQVTTLNGLAQPHHDGSELYVQRLARETAELRIRVPAGAAETVLVRYGKDGEARLAEASVVDQRIHAQASARHAGRARAVRARTRPDRCGMNGRDNDKSKREENTMRGKALLTAGLVGVALGSVAAATADSTPVGPLPAGPVAKIQTQRGELIAVALPQRRGGRVWRLARPIERGVLREVSEANVGASTVVVFRARVAGSALVAFALTRSDTSSKALEARRFHVTVSAP